MTGQLKLRGERHETFRNALLEVVDSFDGNLSRVEILAVTSFIVGQLVAIQFPHEVPPDLAMEVVTKNIELGRDDVQASITPDPAHRIN